jgi:hypothetical protein
MLKEVILDDGNSDTFQTLETHSILAQLTTQYSLYYFVLIKFADITITFSNQLMDNLCHHVSVNWSDIQIYTHVSRIKLPG